MTGALNIDATGTAISVPYGDINIGTEPMEIQGFMLTARYL